MGTTGLRLLGAGTLIGVITACGGQATGRSGVADGTPRTGADGDAGVTRSGEESGVDAGKPTRLTVRTHGLGNVQIRDEEKGTDCTPTPADDGTERCLPPYAGAGRVLFADSECTIPVIFPTSLDPCDTAPPAYFAHYGGPAGCAARKTTTYTRGSTIETPSALYNQSLGNCYVVKDSDRPSFGLVDGTFYEALPLPASDWVKLTKETVPVTDALALVGWKGADDSVIPDGFELLSSGTPCTPYPSDARPGDERRCVPAVRAVVSSGVHGDAICEGPPLATSCTPTEVLDLGSEMDDSGTLVEHLSEAVSAGSTGYFVNPFAGRACEVFPAFPGDASYLYTPGGPLALNRYPLLDLTVEGTVRLQTQYWTSNGKNLLAQSLYDSTYGETCTPMQLSDGGRWCVPNSTIRFDYYGDTRCTVLIGVSTSQVSNTRMGILNPGDGRCPDSTPPVLHVAIPSTGSSYYAMQFSDNEPPHCDLVGSVPGNVRLFEPGMPLDPSTVFAAAPPDP
jgi:hypothetical protein